MSQSKSTPKVNIKYALKFFKNNLTSVNDKRLQLNRSKGLAKYVTAPLKKPRDITPLDNTLGVMSFSLYLLRFLTNIGLLIHLNHNKLSPKSHQKEHRDLCYSLLNDSLWCTVNLLQFFWFSYRNSVCAGLHGMQLEAIAQLVDILVTLLRYQEDKKEHDLKYSQASEIERAQLEIEWQMKELQLLRSLLISLSVVTVFGLFAFSVVTLPISPIISGIIIISSLTKVLIDIEKDRKLIEQLKLNGESPQKVFNEKQKMTNARLKDLNQIILNNVFLPLAICMLITTPIPLTIIACVSMLLVHYLLDELIEISYPSLDTTSVPFLLP